MKIRLVPIKDIIFNRNTKKYIFCLIALTPALFNFLFFWCQINISSVSMAFKDRTGFGFGNFIRLFDEFQNPYSLISESLKNTMIFFFFGLLVSNPMVFMFAYFLYKKIRGFEYYRFVFYLPCIISSVVMTALVKFMAGPNGPISAVWEFVSGADSPIFFADSDYALGSILIYSLWSGFGSGLIFQTVAMKRIPEGVTEYNRIEGVGMITEITKIIIPLIWPTLSVFLLMSFVGIFNASGPILLFTNGEYKTYTLAFWIYRQTVDGVNYEYVSAVGLFFTMIGLPITLIVKFLADRVEPVEF